MKLQHTIKIWDLMTDRVHTGIFLTLSEVGAFRREFLDTPHEEIFDSFGYGDKVCGVTIEDYIQL